jgi:hypothetical protein
MKHGDAMVFLALPFCLSYIGDLSFQLTPFIQSHDRMAGSSSINSLSSNRDGETYSVYNQLSKCLFEVKFGCIFSTNTPSSFDS